MSRKKNPAAEDMARIHIWMDKDHIRLLKLYYEEDPGFSAAIRMILGDFFRRLHEKYPEPQEELLDVAELYKE